MHKRKIQLLSAMQKMRCRLDFSVSSTNSNDLSHGHCPKKCVHVVQHNLGFIFLGVTKCDTLPFLKPLSKYSFLIEQGNCNELQGITVKCTISIFCL